jgi:hypothetical protein
MAIAGMYGLMLDSVFNKTFDYTTDTIVCILLDSTYSPDLANDQYIGDLVGELTDMSYARATVGGKTQTYNSTTRTLTLDCADVTFTALTETNVKYAVWAADVGTDSVSPLLCYWDFQVLLNPTANDLKLTINASGLMSLTVAAAA